jgi:hypothetical protein
MPDTNVLQPISSPLVGKEKLSGWGYLQDIALAPIRGAEGLVKSVYELADWATGDRLLKDYKQGGFLGESQTLAGGLIEGISQFAIGWGTTGLATKLIAKGIPMLASAQAGLGATAKALSAGDKVTKGARLAQFGANAGKGAVVDFWAFEGDEGRLSDLIQKYPALQNPITEFLSSDGDDGELEGRLKNTAEGLGLGAAVDLLVASSKALRNTTKNGGVTPEDLAQVDKQMKLMDATKQAEEVKVSLKTSKKGEGVQLKSDPRLFAYKSHGEAAQSYLDKAKGKPVFYHGTPETSLTAEALDTSRSGANLGPGAYFTPSEYRASGYAGDSGKLIAATLDYTKPYRVGSQGVIGDEGLRLLREKPEEAQGLAERFFSSRASSARKRDLKLEGGDPVKSITGAELRNQQLFEEGYDAIEVVWGSGGSKEIQEVAVLYPDLAKSTGTVAPATGLTKRLSELTEAFDLPEEALSGEDAGRELINWGVLNGSSETYTQVGGSTALLLDVKIDESRLSAETAEHAKLRAEMGMDDAAPDSVLGKELASYLSTADAVRTDNEIVKDFLKAEGYKEQGGIFVKLTSLEESKLELATKANTQSRSYVVNGESAKSSGLHAEEVDKVLSTSLVGRIVNGDTKFKAEVDDTVAHYVEAALLPLRKYAENGMKGPKGGAPVRFDDVLEKVSESIKRMNETTLTSDDLGYLREVMAENVDKYIDKLVGDDPKIAATTLEKFMESAKDELIDYSIRTGGLGELSYEKALAGLREGNDQVARGMIKQQAMRPMVSQAVLELHALAERTIAAVDSGTNPDFIEEFLSSAEVLKDLQLAYDETKYLAGLNLRIQGSDAGDVALYTTRGIQRENVRGLKRIKARTQDPLRAKELAEDILKFVDPDNLETVDKFAAGIRETNVGRKWDGYKAWIKNNLLWSPATHVMNFTNNNLKILMRSGEQYFGAKITGFFTKNPEVAQEMKWQAEGATVELRKFLTNIQDGLHIMKTTWKAGGQGKLLDTNAVKALDGVSHDPLAAGAYVKATSPADMKAYLHNFKVGLGELVMPVHSMPGRALSSIDEGMKTMNYDASFQSLSYIEGRRRGLSELEAEKFSSRMFQESKMAGGRMTSDKGYNEYAREVAEQRINERFGDAVVSPVARRDAIATEQKAIYEAINPNDQIQKKARTILRQEETNQVPAGTYESFINSPEYRDVDQLFKIGQEAQRRALDNTFQTPTQAGTRRGSLPAFLKRAAGADNVGGAALSTALPFISTPWNVVSYAVDTLVAPFGVALKATKGKQGDFLRKIEAGINSNDPQQLGVAVEYAGRIVMGTTLATSGLLLARSGLITGKRPDNKAEAQLWDDLGIQEYSFRAGDKYISFTRLEPIGTILGIMGDMASTHAMTPNEDKAFFATLATALASNITDKTFLTSLSGVLEAATSGEEHRLNRAVSSLVSPMFANPGVASLNRNLFDEGTVRELRTLTDAIMSKTPGEAQRVDPRRNLFGEVVTRGTPSTTGIVGDAFSMLNPFYTSARKDDRVLNEILTFGDVPTTPSPFIGKLDLRDIPSTSRLASANDERNELVGTVKVGGKTLREALSDLMDSPQYKRLEPTGSTEEFSDPRFLMFQRVIRRYRSRALIELRKNNPEINRLILESDSLQRQINAGRASTVTAQNLLRRT